jgi:signal transduction histidine kinase
MSGCKTVLIRAALGQFGLQVAHHRQMLLQRRQRLLGEGLQLGVLSALGLTLEQRDRLLVIAHLIVDVRAIERRAIELLQLCERRLHGPLRSLARERDVLAAGYRFELVVGFRVIVHHPLAELLHAFVEPFCAASLPFATSIMPPSAACITPEDRASGADREELREARERGRSGDERWHVRKDGSRFYASGVTAPISSPSGAVRGYVKVARDLTDRQEAEASLRRAHDALEDRIRERTTEVAAANRELEAQLRERARAESHVRDLLGRIISAQEDERRRISRDLHDHVGQQVVALRLAVERLGDLSTDGTSSAGVGGRELLKKALDAIARLDRDIDFVTWELRPLVLDDFGLVAAIRRFVDAWSKTVSTHGDFHAHGLDAPRLSPIVETNLYRITQEALNNIHKHAQASVVSVVLERRGDDVTLVIEDDGRGFDVATDGRPKTQQIGLLGMHERVSFIGGALQVESAPGKGTTIYVRVPFSAAERTNSDSAFDMS